MNMAKFCESCGAQLKDGAKFCESCGAKVDIKPEKRFCTSCEKEILPDARFCTSCGAGTDGKTAPPPKAPAQNLPDYMRPGYQQRIRAERQAERNAASTPKKGRGGFTKFVAALLVVALVVTGFV